MTPWREIKTNVCPDIVPTLNDRMLVAIEGIDGSGKNTLATRLARRAAERQWSVKFFSFPQYDKPPFGPAIADYLNGRYGSLDQVAPELAALLYAGDRSTALADLRGALASGDLVLCDRYVSSNFAHQAAKAGPRRDELIKWIADVEYGAFGLPKADLTIYLDLPVERAMQLVLAKRPRDYTADSADLHERDQDYLRRCRDLYQHLAKNKIGGVWKIIECLDSSDALRAPDELADVAWGAIEALATSTQP